MILTLFSARDDAFDLVTQWYTPEIVGQKPTVSAAVKSIEDTLQRIMQDINLLHKLPGECVFQLHESTFKFSERYKRVYFDIVWQEAQQHFTVHVRICGRQTRELFFVGVVTAQPHGHKEIVVLNSPGSGDCV